VARKNELPTRNRNNYELDEVAASGDELDRTDMVRGLTDIEDSEDVEGSAEPDGDGDETPIDRDNVGGNGIVIEPPGSIDSENEVRCSNQAICLNGGTCYLLPGKSFRSEKQSCDCVEPFTGERCESYDLFVTQKSEDGVPDRFPQPEYRYHPWLSHPAFIAAVVVAGLLLVGLIVGLVACCSLCVQRKDEGSYALNDALRGVKPKIEYTKVENNSQEFYA